ncbi:hypothetical protein SAMN05421788_101962 [Filimonas lacunae]|uniref:Uncharacterized protein n=1 Tax=Filimonas lacunae TaxID=477680 RepID=A0A173MQ10_9BACT|nr:hypothetical protein [Filimonas lacunae]BAV09529.1 hypothetical protein FLA_5578 [Filimonas lacunae]SIS74700.1 hypothetical protein SAMN05421788_101962 [Filimonas lacunae]
MKCSFHYILPALLALLVSLESKAQPSPKDARIKDSIIGWQDHLTKADTPTKPFITPYDTFSLHQQRINNLFVQWMQQSYTPVGGLGRYSKYFYYQKNNHYPHSYGVMFKAYSVGFRYLDAQGHFAGIAETWVPFHVSVNSVNNAWGIYYLNNDIDYYFTLPEEFYAESRQNQEVMQKTDPKINPYVHKYLTNVTGFWQTTYLVPGNKLPIVQLTKGEFLTLTEAAIDRHLANKKKELESTYRNSPKDVSYFYNTEVESMSRVRNGIQQLKAKHKSDWNEPAKIRTTQPTLLDFDGSIDPFDIDKFEQGLNKYGFVYRFEPAAYARCKADKPQWITISIAYAAPSYGNKAYEMYRSVMEFINYDYIYNYFFDPEKVKGQPYRPNNEAKQKEILAGYNSPGKPASR